MCTHKGDDSSVHTPVFMYILFRQESSTYVLYEKEPSCLAQFTPSCLCFLFQHLILLFPNSIYCIVSEILGKLLFLLKGEFTNFDNVIFNEAPR